MINNNEDNDNFGKYTENQTKIRRFLQEGRSRRQAFNDICTEMNLETLPNEEFDLMFLYAKDGNVFNDVPEELGDYRDLALMVTDECVRIENAIAECPTAMLCSEVCFLDSRYAICLAIERSRPKLFLLDLYHGQTRKFQVRDNALRFCKYNDYNFELVDSRFLLVIEHNEPDRFNVHCLLLDYNEMDCKLIGDAQVQNDFYAFVPDCKQSTKFGFISTTEDRSVFYLHLGSIVRSSQFNVETKPIQFTNEFYCTRLDGNYFYTFEYHDNTGNNNEKIYEFGKYSLVPGQEMWNFDKICEISTAFTQDFRQCKEVKKRLNVYVKHGCLTAYMNEYEEILTLCVDDPLDERPVIYRFALREPDRLLDQIMFGCRRKAMFFGSGKYNELLPKLPNPLQPFGNSPAKTMGMLQGLNELQLDARSMSAEMILYVWNLAVNFIQSLNGFELLTLSVASVTWFILFWCSIYLKFFA